MAVDKYPNWEKSRPHTSVSVNSDALSSSTTNSEKAVVVFGSAEGGKPGTLYRLTSLPQARNIFVGGELLDWVEMAWSPSSTSEGAGVIYAMRVDEATSASTKIGNVTFNSEQFGVIANQVAVSMKQNNKDANFSFTVVDGVTGRTETYENLGDLLDIKYTGTGKAVTAKIEKATLTVTVDDAVYATFTLGDKGMYSTVAELHRAINLDENLVSTFSLSANKSVETKYVEDADLGNIKSAASNIRSVVGSLIENAAYSELITIEAENGATLEAFAQTQLTGGANGNVPTSWRPVFDSFMEVDAPLAYYLVPLTSDEGIHGELKAFVEETSSKGYPLRGIVGASFESPVNELRQRRAKLASSRVSLVGFSADVRMSDGRLLKASPYMATAFVAGIASGLPNGAPVTFKNIRVDALPTFSTAFTSEEMDLLYEEGVITAEKSRNRTTSSFRISSDVTTTNETSDVASRSMAIGEVTDFLGNGLRIELDDTFIGERTSLATATDIKMAVIQFLGVAMNNGEIQDYDPANVNVVVIGDNAQVSFSVVPARSLNTIRVGISYRNEQVIAQ